MNDLQDKKRLAIDLAESEQAMRAAMASAKTWLEHSNLTEAGRSIGLAHAAWLWHASALRQAEEKGWPVTKGIAACLVVGGVGRFD